MEMRFYSIRVKKLIKVGLSEGGGVQLDFGFPLKVKGGAEGLIMNAVAKEILC